MARRAALLAAALAMGLALSGCGIGSGFEVTPRTPPSARETTDPVDAPPGDGQESPPPAPVPTRTPEGEPSPTASGAAPEPETTAGSASPPPRGSNGPTPEGSVSPAPEGEAMPTTDAVDPLALDAMTYLGACGAEAPYRLTPVVDGRQQSPTSMGGTSRRADVVTSQPVTLGERSVQLVELRCSTGLSGTRGWHLVADKDGEPVDLGMIAAGDKAAIVPEDGQLRVELTYQGGSDPDNTMARTVEYRVALVGDTPVRLFLGTDLSMVPASVAQWPAQSWARGLGAYEALALGGDDRSPKRRGIAVLADADTAVAPYSMVNEMFCEIDPALVTTTDSSSVRVERTRTPAEGGGAILDLTAEAVPEPAEVVYRTGMPDSPRAGLLVPVNGLAPTPALVTTREVDMDGDPSVVVRAGAPTDSMLGEGAWFAAPTGVVLDVEGRITHAGAWTDFESHDELRHGMRPLPDPETSDEAYEC